MAGPRGLWAAIPVLVMHAPPIARMRQMHSSDADVYYYRAVVWCKQFCPSGELVGQWADLAVGIMWPLDPPELEELFRRSGLVEGERAVLWSWSAYNGWIIAKYAADAKRAADKRAAAKRAAKTRAAKRRAAALEIVRTPGPVRVSTGERVGRSGRESADHPRTVRGRG